MPVFTMRPIESDPKTKSEIVQAWDSDEVFEISFCENFHFLGERFRQSELIDGVSVRLEYASGSKRITRKVRSENV